MTYKEAAEILCDTILDNPCGCDGCPLSSEEVDEEGNMICELRKCEE